MEIDRWKLKAASEERVANPATLNGRSVVVLGNSIRVKQGLVRGQDTQAPAWALYQYHRDRTAQRDDHRTVACVPEDLEPACIELRRRKLLSEGLYCLGLYGRLLVWYVEPTGNSPSRAKTVATTIGRITGTGAR